MAKVVNDKQEVVTVSWWGDYKILAIAAGIGLVWWLVWLALKEYVLDAPLTAGSVAHVATAIIGTGVLIRLKLVRPLVVAIGTAAALWTLGSALPGLWWGESLAWSVGLFVLSYGLFALIANIRKLWLSVSVAIVVALILIILLAQ